MTRFKPMVPSPALLVAAAALVAALVGTAVAGPVEISLNKREKKQTRKIATKVAKKQANRLITRRSSNLSVKSAESADTAGFATNALNAGALEGKGAAAFVPADKLVTSGSAVKLAVGETKTIFTKGPFRFEGTCTEPTAGQPRITINLFSTEAGSRGDVGGGGGFAIPPGSVQFAAFQNAGPFSGGFNYQLFAPSGATLAGHMSGAVNVGSDCSAAGFGIG